MICPGQSTHLSPRLVTLLRHGLHRALGRHQVGCNPFQVLTQVLHPCLFVLIPRDGNSPGIRSKFYQGRIVNDRDRDKRDGHFSLNRLDDNIRLNEGHQCWCKKQALHDDGTGVGIALP